MLPNVEAQDQTWTENTFHELSPGNVRSPIGTTIIAAIQGIHQCRVHQVCNYGPAGYHIVQREINLKVSLETLFGSGLEALFLARLSSP